MLNQNINHTALNRTNALLGAQREVRFWLYQCIGWMPFFLLQLVLLGNDKFVARENLIFATLATVSSILASQLLRFRYRRLLKQDTSGWSLTGWLLIMSSLMSVLADFGLHASLLAGSTIWSSLTSLSEQQPMFSNTPFIFINLIVWSGLYLLIKRQEQLANEVVRKQEIALMLKESEVRNLQMQLNPHFLFNTLNNIRALVTMDVEKAREAIYMLAGLMRYQINNDTSSLSTLKDEMLFVRQYISLCQLQFGKKLVFTEQVDSALEGKIIPRLTIQLLVENAVKHGFKAVQPNYFLDISVITSATGWVISVNNSGVLVSPHCVHDGVGLVNLLKRLAFHFDDKASFSIKQIDDRVESRIQFES